MPRKIPPQPPEEQPGPQPNEAVVPEVQQRNRKTGKVFRRVQGHKLTQWLEELRAGEDGEEAYNAIIEYAKKPGVAFSDVYRLVREYGYPGAYSSVINWMESYFPVGQEAARLNTISQMFKGMDFDGVLEAALGKIMLILLTISDGLDEDEVGALDSQTRFLALPNYIREMRSLITQMQTMKVKRNNAELERAGLYRAFEELEAVFRGTAFEEPLQTAIKGVIARYEEKG